jgi:predicted nucleic acid-binding protein
MKAIIFDSSTLISFAMNGLYDEIAELKKIFDGKFLIPKEVKYEVIDRPMQIKRFELEALQIKRLLDEKIFEMPDSVGVKDSEVSVGKKQILDTSGELFEKDHQKIKPIDEGEAACLALSKILNKKKIKNIIAMDERTTRILCEKPENLKDLMERRLHAKILVKKENYKLFSGFTIIRSAELIYVAYKKGLINYLKNGVVLDALLYAMKFKGCAITFEEIEEMKKLK